MGIIGGTAESLTERGLLFLEDRDWESASNYFNTALNINPRYAPAYVGLLCAELKVVSESRLMNVRKSFSENPKYLKAIRFADENYRAKLEEYSSTVKKRMEAEHEMASAEVERQQKETAAVAKRKPVQDAFDQAMKLMEDSYSRCDYQKVIDAFRDIKSDYEDMNIQITEKIAECERLNEIDTPFDIALLSLREHFHPQFRALKEASLKEERRIDLENLNAENDKAEALNNAECRRLRQEYNAAQKAWQDDVDSLKAEYDKKFEEWEAKVNDLKTQAETWKSQKLCQHCGGKIKLFGSCKLCKRKKDEKLEIPPQPEQPDFPSEPAEPDLPEFIPQVLDESLYILKEKRNFELEGINWRIVDTQHHKVLLVSEEIIERCPFDEESVYNLVWENCSLRKYLNGSFLDKLTTIKPAVAKTTNENPSSDYYKGCNTTTDRIFLLSKNEARRYFNVNENYPNETNTGIAKYENKPYWWWLRWINKSGELDIVNENGNSHIMFCYQAGGIRPALWLNI